MDGIFSILKKHTSTVLCITAAVGIIITAVLSAKAAPKAAELLKTKEADENRELTLREKIKTAAPVYIPTMISCALTIVCVFGANMLNKKQQASMAGAYALLNSNYNRYKNKLQELYGETTHDRIMEALNAEEARSVPIYAPSICRESSLGVENTDERKRLFYEPYSQRYFESTLSQVLQAQYHVNRNFVLGGDIALNDLYLFLGIDGTEEGESIGWSRLDGYDWIDFNNTISELDDGTKYYRIDAMFPPESFSEDD